MTTKPDRTSVVTGAASGIGRALATLLARRGYDLTLVDIDRPGVQSLAADLGAGRAATLDVSDHNAMQDLADDIGAVDVLCLNAGVVSTSMGPPWEASPEEWTRVLDVNLLGVVNGLRSFVPLQLASDQPSQILITASLAGVLTWPGGGPYAASKHAVVAVAEQTALHLADTHVSVAVMCPALVRTAMSDIGDDPLDVATVALDAAAAGRFAVLPPSWSTAVHARADTLTSGKSPQLPTPDDAGS